MKDWPVVSLPESLIKLLEEKKESIKRVTLSYEHKDFISDGERIGRQSFPKLEVEFK